MARVIVRISVRLLLQGLYFGGRSHYLGGTLLLERRLLRTKDTAISPVVAVIILVGITVVLAGVLYIWVTNTMQAGGLGKSSTPSAIFVTKNSAAALNDLETDQKIATVTLNEGSLLISELSIMVSANGDTYDEYPLNTASLIPNGPPAQEWNAGEALILSEDHAPTVTRLAGNWGSEDVYIRIIYTPSAKIIYTEHITVEQSTPLAPLTSWSAQSSLLGPNVDLWDVSFINATHGWSVGITNYGRASLPPAFDGLISTTDGGATWTASPSAPPLDQSYCVFFLDANHGWVGGLTYQNNRQATPCLYSTTDGGQTWIPSTIPYDDMIKIQFIDSQHGFVLAEGSNYEGDRIVYVTTDGGSTWSERSIPLWTVTDIQFVDAQTGWAVGGGSISRTTDAGQTWEQQFPGMMDDRRGRQSSFRSLSMTDATHGWVLDSSGAVYSTTNGVDWEGSAMLENEGGAAYRDIAFFDATHGWAVGMNDTHGVIYETTDGGLSWDFPGGFSGPENSAFNEIHIEDADHIWVVGDGAIIYRFGPDPI